jgi:AraC-like DNA-binding protein
LQRRIVEESTWFRQLLVEARRALAREYLNRPETAVDEVAYRLGYGDTNSFYRAFRTWEGTTLTHWRSGLRGANERINSQIADAYDLTKLGEFSG